MTTTIPSYDTVQAHADAVESYAVRLERIAHRLRQGAISTESAVNQLRQIATVLDATL